MADQEITVRFSAEGVSQINAAIGVLSNAMKGAETSAHGFSGSLNVGTGSLDGFLTKLLLLPGAIQSSIGLLRSAAGSVVEFVDSLAGTDKIAEVNAAFRNLTASMGGAQAVLNALKAATEGEVSAEALRASVVALGTRGIKLQVDQLQLLATTFKRLSDVGEGEVLPSFQAIAQAISTQQPRALRPCSWSPG